AFWSAKPFCSSAAFCLLASSSRLNDSGKFFGLLGQDFGLFLLACRRFQRPAGLARNDMDMKVEDALTAGPLTQLLNGDALCSKRLGRRLGSSLRNGENVREIVRTDIEDVARWGFRQHQRMTG